MTVEQLVALLNEQNPKAAVYLVTARVDLDGDVTLDGDAAYSSIESVKTYPLLEGVFILEDQAKDWL